jgi:hypothetical protein
MAKISELVSEIAHSVKQPNNEALKENIKLLIIQTRNEVIRRSFENHGYVDRILTQRFRVELIDVNDGDIELPEEVNDTFITKIKRTKNIVPRPVRLPNNLPFDRVSTVCYKTNKEIPFVKETTARFLKAVPGLCGNISYDYINGYIYVFPSNNKHIPFNKIIIESAFEHPNEIDLANGVTDELSVLVDENEYLLSEDMIGQIKELVYKRGFFDNVRETNETSINTNVI